METSRPVVQRQLQSIRGTGLTGKGKYNNKQSLYPPTKQVQAHVHTYTHKCACMHAHAPYNLPNHLYFLSREDTQCLHSSLLKPPHLHWLSYPLYKFYYKWLHSTDLGSIWYMSGTVLRSGTISTSVMPCKYLILSVCRCYSKSFTCSSSLNPHNSPMKSVLLLRPLCRPSKWNTNELKARELVSRKTRM